MTKDYTPEILTTEEALRRGPEDGVAYVVMSGLTAEEKVHVIEQVRLLNEKLANGEIK